MQLYSRGRPVPFRLAPSILAVASGLLLLGAFFPAASEADDSGIYFTTLSKVNRADLDGTNVQTILDLSAHGNSTIADLKVDPLDGKIYTAQPAGPDTARGIWRMNLDGSNLEPVLPDLNSVFGLDLDLVNGKVYYGHVGPAGTREINRANLDGSNVEILWTIVYGKNLALDAADGSLFWANTPNSGNHLIYRGTIGGGYTTTSQGNGPQKVALDRVEQKVYVHLNTGVSVIKRMNYDFTNQEIILPNLGNQDTVHGLTVDEEARKLYWVIENTGVDDRIQRSNLDGTGVEDIVLLGGQNPKAICVVPAGAVTGIASGLPAGAAALTLHQNAPNPFAPRTNISFHVPNSTRVTLRVFDVQGRAVRTLVDSERNGAGTIGWDGRDDSRRALPSGTYFYRLQAGTSSETRKLTLLR